MIKDEILPADLDGRRVDLDGIDEAELPQVANMVFAWVHDDAGGALCLRSQAEPVKKVRRGFVGELGIELHVQMVVLVALPGVHGGGESRD